MNTRMLANAPVGIGPVITGRQGECPAYYIDLVYPDGSTERLFWTKACRGADRMAKLSAIRQRIALAEKLRPEVVLAHDQQSFQGLVTIIKGLRGMSDKIRHNRRRTDVLMGA